MIYRVFFNTTTTKQKQKEKTNSHSLSYVKCGNCSELEILFRLDDYTASKSFKNNLQINARNGLFKWSYSDQQAPSNFFNSKFLTTVFFLFVRSYFFFANFFWCFSNLFLDNLMGTVRSLDGLGPSTLNCTYWRGRPEDKESMHCEWGLISRDGW